MKTKIILVSIIVVAVLAVGIYYIISKPVLPPKALQTYFEYSNDALAPFRTLTSSKVMGAEDLYAWDKITFDLVSKGTGVSGFDPNTSKIYAYLAVAQRDVAFLSFNAKGKFMGSLGPVSKEVLCLFFANDCAKIGQPGDKDEYSETLAKIVIEKVKARITEDDASVTPYPVEIGPEYWDGPEPRIGIAEGSRKTWFITSGSQFRVSPPPVFGSAEFERQLTLVKDGLRNTTDQQRQAVVSWAGGPGTKTPPGQWLEIADKYMREKKVNFETVLRVRAALTMTLADAVIAVFDSKYTYWTRRPFMMNPLILTVMPTPNHPSYPAGHSVLSTAAATILGDYFPEEKARWDALAQEAGFSRVWGGIHYPMDNEQGNVLGENVAEEALRNVKI